MSSVTIANGTVAESPAVIPAGEAFEVPITLNDLADQIAEVYGELRRLRLSAVPPTTKPGLLSVNAAAAMLGIKRTKLFQLLSDGELKAVRIGGRRLIAEREVERLMQRLANLGDRGLGHRAERNGA